MDEQSGEQSSEFPTLTEATYGQALQRARELAGMSQSKLAELAGLQRTTIRNIERDITRAAPDTRLRLAKVLRIDFAAGPAPVEPWSPHQHFAPSYAPLQLASEMTAALNAPGGSLDQVFLYLDPQSAVDWMEYSNDAAYVRNFRDRMPLEAAAAIVVRQIGAVGLDVVALGAGDGKSETRLTQHLVDLLPQPPDLRLYLLDISHALLHSAFRYAADSLHIPIYPIHGDFYELPRYPVLAYRAPHDRRARIWTFIGNTFGNLSDESEFFLDLHACARAGDFAVVHVQTTWAPASDLAAVRAADPASGKAITGIVERWLSGPIRRHCRGLRDLSMSSEVTSRCQISGSYEWQVTATVTLHDGEQRRYVACRFRRYDVGELSGALRDVGWETVETWPFGPEPQRCALLLLRRV